MDMWMMVLVLIVVSAEGILGWWVWVLLQKGVIGGSIEGLTGGSIGEMI